MGYLAVSRVVVMVASLFITISLYDQALKIWRTKSAKDFTATIIAALLVNEIAWLNYGFSLSEWPIIVLGFLNVPAAIIAFIGYIKYRRGGANSEARTID